ncbi:aminotransferase class I/II-fold pyridoxal phosphate-dependent enzyme [Saccharothrix sp. AJ9571]|nr:aminotransferase class I/II-fold pyridoxal phosphate-dependent enzyme [Saccharothrix sp. AJ9571]
MPVQPTAELFERELAQFLGVADVVAVATGTAALHLALLAAGVGPGEEVLVPSLTFCASVQAILATGAHPRFVEVDPASLCVTAEHIADALSAATRAVMPVLYGGRAIDLSPIQSQLAERKVTIVEDAAHAFGSCQGPRRVGATREHEEAAGNLCRRPSSRVACAQHAIRGLSCQRRVAS